MSRKRKSVRILKKIATAILAVIMFASLAAGLFMGILNKTAESYEQVQKEYKGIC